MTIKEYYKTQLRKLQLGNIDYLLNSDEPMANNASDIIFEELESMPQINPFYIRQTEYKMAELGLR